MISLADASKNLQGFDTGPYFFFKLWHWNSPNNEFMKRKGMFSFSIFLSSSSFFPVKRNPVACSAEQINMLSMQLQYSKKGREKKKEKRILDDASVIYVIGVRDHSESFYYFLLKHSRCEIHNCLLLIKKGKLFCTYYRAHVCENWILILSVNLFCRAVMHCSYCC